MGWGACTLSAARASPFRTASTRSMITSISPWARTRSHNRFEYRTCRHNGNHAGLVAELYVPQNGDHGLLLLP